MSVCKVCNTPYAALWMCSHPRCPKEQQQFMTDMRKTYRDQQEGFGRPEIEEEKNGGSGY